MKFCKNDAWNFSWIAEKSTEIHLNRFPNIIFKEYTKKQWDKYPIDLNPSVLARLPFRLNNDDKYFYNNGYFESGDSEYLYNLIREYKPKKIIEIGSGFSGIEMTGSEHNDEFFVNDDNKIKTKTNHSGGVQGGISNGEDIILRAAFKPTATIIRSQKTVDSEHNIVELKGKGRHDPCVLPRAVPIVEAMVAIVIADHALLNTTNNNRN